MKPAPFEYVAPASLEEALALRAEHAGECAVLAGGQSLMPVLNMRLAAPRVLIDLRRVAELDGIAESEGRLAIGAMTRQRTVERSTAVAARWPLLAHALRHIGHPAIRNRGTIGGSLAHSDPAAELPAVALALDAELVVRSVREARIVPAGAFFLGTLMTALEPDELLVEVRFPLIAGGAALHEVARRHGDFALVGAAAVVARDGDDAIADARIAFIGVGATAVRAHDAEAALRAGASPIEVAEMAASTLEPVDDIHATGEYRRRVAAVLARRALLEAAA